MAENRGPLVEDESNSVQSNLLEPVICPMDAKPCTCQIQSVKKIARAMQPNSYMAGEAWDMVTARRANEELLTTTDPRRVLKIRKALTTCAQEIGCPRAPRLH